MSDGSLPARPATPQIMVHRLPDKPDDGDASNKPSKYLVMIMGSTGVAGKGQIATAVSKGLDCPVYQADSIHQSLAKAAEVGGGRRVATATTGQAGASGSDTGAKEARYQRMWLARMTRTGLLFPEESKAAGDAFTGFGGGSSSTSTSRRGSASSVDSVASNTGSTRSSIMSAAGVSSGPPTTQAYNNTVFTMSEKERRRRENPALFVTTHPILEPWHKLAIRNAVGDYGIGVIFVPLEGDGELPVLKPLDPRTMTSFGSFGSFGAAPKVQGSLKGEMVLTVDIDADVETIAAEIVDGVKDIMGTP